MHTSDEAHTQVINYQAANAMHITQGLTPQTATHLKANFAHHGSTLPWFWGIIWSKVPPYAHTTH